MVVRDRSGTEPAAGDAAAAGCEQPTAGQPRGGGHGVSGAGTRDAHSYTHGTLVLAVNGSCGLTAIGGLTDFWGWAAFWPWG